MTSSQPTPYRREAGYAERYRDRRFRTGSGPGTHRRETGALQALLATAAPPAGVWLDAPAGAGRFSDLLPGQAIQLDVQATMLRACPPGPDGAPRARVAASAHQLPFADDVFAGALCMRLLQHLPSNAERIAVLSELRRVTRGPVLVSFFNAWSVQHQRRRLRRRLGKTRSGRSAIALRTMREDLAAAGLRITASRPLRRFWSEQWLLRCERSDA